MLTSWFIKTLNEGTGRKYNFYLLKYQILKVGIVGETGAWDLRTDS